MMRVIYREDGVENKTNISKKKEEEKRRKKGKTKNDKMSDEK
jgi:hypothetical protein